MAYILKMLATHVGDKERVYRCVFHSCNDGAQLYTLAPEGIKISSQAFRDSGKCPSVDREDLCGANPHHTQKSTDDGVVCILCERIRKIDDVVQNDKKGKPEFVYLIDVVHRPELCNIAHSQIESAPVYRNTKSFRRLMESLAYIVNSDSDAWLIMPADAR
jgi:hypothetical protein